MEDRKSSWRKLDNSAKIFPISSGKKYSTVFRLSALLKENIDKNTLEEAVKKTLKKYKSFKVKMKEGFFWYYLEENFKEPIIEEEKDYPCKYIEPKTNNGYLFKVTYFEKKINIDIYHALTDGGSGTVFFREIIYTYLELKHKDEFENNERIARKIEDYIEDSYIKNYNKKLSKRDQSGKAFEVKGKKIKLGAISAIHEIIDLEDVKREAKKYQATITQYLTSVLIYSIYNANYKNSKRPIKTCIPVNLKKYFPSDTMSNFFSYITIVTNKEEITSFENLLEFVKKEFKEKLSEEEIIKTMSANVKLGNNPFVRVIPLSLKKILVRLSYIEIRKYTTITFSNIGRIGIIGKYQKYIEDFFMLIAPEPVEKIKCSACTYENDIVFTFTSILQDNSIEKRFFEFLTQNGIKVRIESNGVLDAISTKN